MKNLLMRQSPRAGQGRSYAQSNLIPLLQKRMQKVPLRMHKNILTSNLSKDGPLIISGKGALLKTVNQQKIIDFSSMTVNCCLGQNDPWIKANMMAYIKSDMPSFLTSRLRSSLYCQYPQRLHDIKIGGINDVRINHRQCNGSDVTELALKSASEQANGRRYVASFEGGYHGQNLTSYYVSEKQKHLRFLVEEDNILFLPSPNHSNDEAVKLSNKESEILNIFRDKASDTYALILEPIQMNNNIIKFSKIFLQALREICDQNEICLIYDEVQTGFGWLGHLTSSEATGVKPDILALSKGITSGFGPLAVMATTEKYSYLPYGCGEKTNGSDIRSLIAANAVLDRLLGIKDENIIDVAPKDIQAELRSGLLSIVPAKAEAIRRHMSYLQESYPDIVGEIRQAGMICGLEIKPNNRFKASDIVAKSLPLGLFLRNTGNFLIIKPPLTIQYNEIQTGFEILENTIINM